MTDEENEDQRGLVACLRHRARTENLILIGLFPKSLPLTWGLWEGFSVRGGKHGG